MVDAQAWGFVFWGGGAVPDLSLPPAVPLPPAGQLRVRDVTHSTMNLDWDAAPGPVEKYLITYKPDSGDAKEVSSRWFLRCPPFPGAVIKPRLKKAPLFWFFFWRTSRA